MKAELVTAIRHIDVRLCVVGSYFRSLFYRWYVKKVPFPQFESALVGDHSSSVDGGCFDPDHGLSTIARTPGAEGVITGSATTGRAVLGHVEEAPGAVRDAVRAVVWHVVVRQAGVRRGLREAGAVRQHRGKL